MRIGTALDLRHPRELLVVDCGEQWLDLQQVWTRREGTANPWFRSMQTLLDAGPAGMAAVAELRATARERLTDCLRAASDLHFLSPLPRPRSIRDCMSFEGHVRNCMRTNARYRWKPLAMLDRWAARSGRALLRPPQVWYERPIYYKGNPAAVSGPDDDVVWPDGCEWLDYELEFGAFIGREGRDLSPQEAMECVAGYSIFNDFTARDLQMAEQRAWLGPSKSKDFDSGNVIGPYLVTTDEVPDPSQLVMSAHVNDQMVCRAGTGDLQHSVADTLAFISRNETLYPGDFIAFGTPAGGCGFERDERLQDGDVVRLEVEGLGSLTNRVVRPPRDG